VFRFRTGFRTEFNVDFLQAILLNALIPATKNIRLKNFKITSGSTPETGRQVDALYQSVITAGTHGTIDKSG
jgi:UDP-N-acetyl-D-galactosamine dehydrogenase